MHQPTWVKYASYCDLSGTKLVAFKPGFLPQKEDHLLPILGDVEPSGHRIGIMQSKRIQPECLLRKSEITPKSPQNTAKIHFAYPRRPAIALSAAVCW
jgi:hypothetical protein